MEEDRCWICLGNKSDPPPPGVEEQNWRRPCPCSSMLAHEACLLEWAADSDKPVVKCPQCRRVIEIERSGRLSSFLKLRDATESYGRFAAAFCFSTAVGGTIAGATYSVLYAAGASAITWVCPSDMALELLGFKLAKGAIEISPMSARQFALIPSIPLILIMSGVRSPLVDAALIILPSTLPGKKAQWLGGPKLTLTVLAFGRMIYQRLYDSFIDPVVFSYAKMLRPNFEGDTEGGGFRFQVMLDDIEERANEVQQQQQQQQQQMAAAPRGEEQVQDAAERENFEEQLRELELRIQDEVEDGPADPNDEEAVGVHIRILRHLLDHAAQVALNVAEHMAGVEVEEAEANNNNLNENNNNNNNNNNNDQFQPPVPQAEGNIVHRRNVLDLDFRQPRRHAGDWVISKRSVVLRVGYALLWPAFAGVAGSILSNIPLVKKIVPDRFNRNIVGACLIVLGRDLVNIATAKLRVEQESSRRVKNYDER